MLIGVLGAWDWIAFEPQERDSLPFEIDRFRFQGNSANGPTPGERTLTGRPRDERRSHPLLSSVSDYSR